MKLQKLVCASFLFVFLFIFSALEIEEQRFRVNLRIVDTPGFGDYINSYNSWVPVLDYIDNQHENYMRQEQQPDRKEINDMRVHVCLYFILPTGCR